MHPLYWTNQPLEGPMPPNRWSYSALSLWRTCPLQWYLARAEYEGMGSPGYPARPTAQAIQGQAVHAALQNFAKARKVTLSARVDIESQVDFPIRATIR